MIRLHRTSIAEPLQERLASLTQDIDKVQAGTERLAEAKRLWKARSAVKRDLKASLGTFAAGRGRCMYCGDNEGTDIDHYKPVALEPLLTFAWANHLLACSRCNSHFKLDHFPVAEDGEPLLLDPTVDDPTDEVPRVPSGAGQGRRHHGALVVSRLSGRRWRISTSVTVEGSAG